MENADDTLASSPTEPEQSMPWLEDVNRPNLQHPSDLVNRLNLQHPSVTLTYHPIRSKSSSSGIFNFLEAGHNTPASPSRALTAESMSMPLSQLSVAASLSRAHSPLPTCTSPTSPTFSELTPTPTPMPESPTTTPESPAIPPTDMALDDGDMDMALVQTDATLADPEGLAGEMSTALGGDAKIELDEASEPSHELNHDRTMEFEQHTTQAREASRIDPETAKDSGVEELQHNSPGLKEQTAPQERDPREHMAEPKPEATPPRLPAAWVNEAILAAKANKKNPLNQGNVLVVLDVTDPTRSCLLDANTLCRASSVLEKLYKDAQAKSSGCISEHGLEGMLVLVLSSASMPELDPEAIDASLESVSPQRKDDHPPSGAAKARHANAGTAKVKKELAQGDSAPAAEDSGVLETGWRKAYECFFRILAGKKHGIPRSDLSTALPLIQGIVQIAQALDAIPPVKGAFDSLFYGYVGKDTFWKSIAAEPVPCIKISIALQNLPVYEEAFKHIVGSSSNFKQGKIVDGLSADVQAIVQRRARELFLKRRNVEDVLTRMSCPANVTPTHRAVPVSQDYPSQCVSVSQHNQPMVYNTVNLFRDWVTDHVGHLRNESDAEPAENYLCYHSVGCDTVAGFFRVIESRDYLDPDEVWDNFSDRYKSRHAQGHQSEREIVKNTLETLKGKAVGLVEEISQCTLHLAENVEYLTCIDVEAEDVPWAVDSDDEESGDEHSDEESEDDE